jgi:hypothetical protein
VHRRLDLMVWVKDLAEKPQDKSSASNKFGKGFYHQFHHEIEEITNCLKIPCQQ